MLGYLGAHVSVLLLVIGMIATAVACASLGMTLATLIGNLENYAVMMNLVIFPVFFLSGSLYPVESLPMYLRGVLINPFAYGVDLLKHAMLLLGSSALGGPDFRPLVDLANRSGELRGYPCASDGQPLGFSLNRSRKRYFSTLLRQFIAQTSPKSC